MVQSAPKPEPADEHGWPRFGRDIMDRQHAIFVLANSLEALKLGNWTHTLVRWLGQYDGLELQLPEDHDPLLCVRNQLTQYLSGGSGIGRVEIGRIAGDLCAMPFLRYRAAWLNTSKKLRRDWLPLEQSWLTFSEALDGEDHLHFWESEAPFPSSDVVRRHLLAGYVRDSGLR